MNKAIIDKVIRGNPVEIEIRPGVVYFAFTSNIGIQEQIFSDLDCNKTFINSSFKSAVKLKNYVNKMSEAKIENLTRDFNIPILKLSRYDIYGILVFAALEELRKNDLIIIETIGLAFDSIKDLVEFSLQFVQAIKTKTIILINDEPMGRKYPFFKIKQIDESRISNFYEWCNVPEHL